MQHKTFGSGLDMGDCLYFLPTVKHLGGGDLFALKGLEHRIPLLKGLLESQPYIASFQTHSGQHIDYNVLEFRKGGIPYGATLAENQSNWLGVYPDFSKPWLEAEPDPDTKGRIVVARTARYQNPYFPWERLVETFGKDMVFIGLREEHKRFCLNYGEIFYLPTPSLLEAAQAIAGAELFIGNQSSPNAICEGLKAPLVQETCLFVPDCIFSRTNAIHCFDGELAFEALGKSFRSERKQFKQSLDTHITPPGGWRITYKGFSAKCYSFESVLNQISAQLRGAGMDVPRTLREEIMEIAACNIAPCEEMKPIQMCRELVASKRTTA